MLSCIGNTSCVVRKPACCICENKDADQLRGNRQADQRLCFRYADSTISLLRKYEISSLQPSTVAVQPGLCGTWSETPKTGFLTTKLMYCDLYSCFVCLCCGLTSQSTIFPSCRDEATAFWVLPVLSGSKVSCSRIQHGRS